MTAPLSYFLETPGAESAYALDFLLRTIGLRAAESATPDGVDLYYGNHPPRGGCKLRIRQSPGLDEGLRTEDVIWGALLRGEIPVGARPDEIAFDLVRATAFFLLDLGNADAPRDAHDRVLAAGSFQHRHNLLQVPAVNHYALFLRERIERVLGLETEPFWPEGKTCAIGLSHDVDHPDLLCLRSGIRGLRRDFMDSLRQRHLVGLLKCFKRGAKLLASATFTRQDQWLFRPIMDEEEKTGARSAFFFQVRNYLDPAGHPLDVRYDIRDRKFPRLFEEIRRRGFEIALHASYNAFEEAKRFRDEKDRLESATGTRVLGLRHHYWHLGPEAARTLKAHEEAGFAYDSSLAFNDMMGFRRSVAFPFRPWSPHEGAPIRTLQVPTFLMDGNLFYRPIAVSEAVDRILQQVSILKAARGVGVIDWHVKSSLPMNKAHRDWGAAYREVLRALAQDDEIWVTSPGEIAAFTRARWESLGYD